MTTRPRTGWTTRLGLAVVAASAVATSFSALTGLAGISGWSGHIAFTLPLIVDTLGVVGTKVWLTGPTAVRPLARSVALLAIICSVSGNIACLDRYDRARGPAEASGPYPHHLLGYGWRG